METEDKIELTTALPFKAMADAPKQLSNPKDAATYTMLTPRQYSFKEIQKQGRISKKNSREPPFTCGD